MRSSEMSGISPDTVWKCECAKLEDIRLIIYIIFTDRHICTLLLHFGKIDGCWYFQIYTKNRAKTFFERTLIRKKRLENQFLAEYNIINWSYFKTSSRPGNCQRNEVPSKKSDSQLLNWEALRVMRNSQSWSTIWISDKKQLQSRV